MPEISRFLGIVIRMYFKDHNPPHFHVSYEKYEATIDIKNLGIISGSLPPKVLALVVEWASFHAEELLDNWSKTKDLKSPNKIEHLT